MSYKCMTRVISLIDKISFIIYILHVSHTHTLIVVKGVALVYGVNLVLEICFCFVSDGKFVVIKYTQVVLSVFVYLV